MALLAILRDAGTTVVRAPLLWFFSVIVLITDDVPSLMQSDSTWLSCISLLLIPIIVIAEAGQIRSVQLHYEGTRTSVSQIIRHGARKVIPLTAVQVITLLLTLLVTIVLWPVSRSLFSQMAHPDTMNLILTIAYATTYPFMAFAQRALVMSNLPLISSLTMVFRAVKNDASTVLMLTVAFSLLSYFIRIAIPVTFTNPVQIAECLVALLIVSGIQSAVFTFAYLYCSGKSGEETTITRQAA